MRSRPTELNLRWTLQGAPFALDPVFVMTCAGELHLFKTPDHAACWVEAGDVLEGECGEFFRVDGERLRAEIVGQPSADRVMLAPTGVVELDHLAKRLHAFAARSGYDGSVEDPREIANQVLAHEWRHSWPRWWPWLHRRLHGDGPPAV